MSSESILVIGATGQQGGAVAANLLADGWSVRAATRDPAGSAAGALAAAGAEPVAVDLDDAESLSAAADGVTGIFSVHPGVWDGGPYGDDPDHEIRSVHHLVAAAKRHRIRHVVHSSSIGIGTELEAVLPMVARKAAAERVWRDSGVSVSFVRPGSFMENLFGEARGLTDGALMTPLWENTIDPLVAVDDIGAVAARMFASPDRFAGAGLELVGDLLTQRQVVTELSRAAGRDVPYVQIPIETIREFSDTHADGLDSINRHPVTVDVEAVRRVHPGLLGFAAWLDGPGRPKLANYFSGLDSAA